MTPDRHEADVAIVGAGIAGIATAIEALSRGRRVLLLDRDVEANLGGLACDAMGGLWFAGTPLQRRYRIQDSIELGYADWLSFGELDADDEWPRAWARRYVERCVPDVFEWLTGLGVRFMPMPMWAERGLHRQGNSVPRFHFVWGTGSALIAALVARLRDLSQRDRLEIRFGHRVDSLLTQDGRVTGVAGITEPDGRSFEVAADAIVIAAGGINGDIDRVRRHWHADWGDPPPVILNGSHRFADGGARRRGHAGRERHAPRLAVELRGGRAPLAATQASRPVAIPLNRLLVRCARRRIGPEPLVTGFERRLAA
jgi:predicted oxidoreductase